MSEYGEYVTGVEVINDKSREAMRNALKRIQTGEYAKMFIQEGAVNYASMTARRRLTADHQIEKVGAQLRSMMPWIAKNKLVDQDKTNLSFQQIKPARAIRQVFYIFAGPIHYKSHSTRPSENNINDI